MPKLPTYRNQPIDSNQLAGFCMLATLIFNDLIRGVWRILPIIDDGGLLAKVVSSSKLITIFARKSPIDVWHYLKYLSQMLLRLLFMLKSRILFGRQLSPSLYI